MIAAGPTVVEELAGQSWVSQEGHPTPQYVPSGKSVPNEVCDGSPGARG